MTDRCKFLESSYTFFEALLTLPPHEQTRILKGQSSSLSRYIYHLVLAATKRGSATREPLIDLQSQINIELIFAKKKKRLLLTMVMRAILGIILIVIGRNLLFTYSQNFNSTGDKILLMMALVLPVVMTWIGILKIPESWFLQAEDLTPQGEHWLASLFGLTPLSNCRGISLKNYTLKQCRHFANQQNYLIDHNLKKRTQQLPLWEFFIVGLAFCLAIAAPLYSVFGI